MAKEMVISVNPHETRVAILEEGQLCEYYVEREKEFALVGSIYKGRVTRVLPGMQSAFVEIGLDSDAFLYVTDFLEGIEEFDPIVTTVEDKAQKLEEQGGQVFPASPAAAATVEPPDVEPGAVHAGESAEAAPSGELAPAASASPARPAPPRENFSSGRGRFDGRQRRDDSGRRGRGRFGRRGGHGGDRRFGRELPSSKYASPWRGEASAEEPAIAEGLIPDLLPGESLAKFKEKAPSSAAPPVQEGEAPLTGETAATAAPEVPETAREVAAPAEPEYRAARAEEPKAEEPRAEERRVEHFASSTGLEPLPGERLSRWSVAEPAALEQEKPAAPAAPEEHAAAVEEYEHAELQGEPAAPELTEEEAAAVAEHVAEAQDEEAARREEHAGFGAVGEAGEPGTETEEEEIESEPESSSIVEDEGNGESMGTAPEEAPPAEPEEISAEAEPASAAESALPQGQPWTARVRNDFRARLEHPARRGRDRDRGRRFHGHGGHHRSQQRRPQLIADLLKQGQEIIVQIAKEPLGKKGARITSHVALPGRYLVYMPTLDHSGVSRKIASAEDRARLRHLVNDAKGTASGGFIVRTAAASAAPEDLRADAEFLIHTWNDIKVRSEQRKAPALLHRDLNLVERILRDHVNGEYAAVWVDSEEIFTKIADFMSRFQPALAGRVKLYTKETPIFEEFGIQQEIDKGLRPKVWLKSGGYIVINHTEALVAIDVNTGKFVGKGSTRLEDTIVRTNLEAAKEIVRQMRLRDLGGIIVIDFIDMEDRRNREKVMAALEDALKADRAPSKTLRFNEFGLIAITRKRTKQALERTLCQPCPYCTGSGMVKSIPTLCYEIQTEARKMAPEIESATITLRVHPEISKALKTRESALIEELEHWTKKSAIIQADPTLHWEQYDIY